MDSLVFSDNEAYESVRGQLRLSVPWASMEIANEFGEIAFLSVIEADGSIASIYLTKEQAIEMRDYLTKLIGETKDNG